jgi:hypothetical protein
VFLGYVTYLTIGPFVGLPLGFFELDPGVDTSQYIWPVFAATATLTSLLLVCCTPFADDDPAPPPDEIEMEQRGEEAESMVGEDHPQNIEDVESDQQSKPARHFCRNLLLGGALTILLCACVGTLVALYTTTQVENLSYQNLFVRPQKVSTDRLK